MKYLSVLFILLTPYLAFSQNFSGQKSLKQQIDQVEKQSDPFTSYMLKVDNPCKDSLYLKLKKMPLDEMSDRQYEVFKQKDKACQEYMNTVQQTQPAKQSAEAAERATKAATTYYIIGGAIGLISTIYLFTI